MEVLWILAAFTGLILLCANYLGLLFNFWKELRAARQVPGHPWRTHWLLGDLPVVGPTEEMFPHSAKKHAERWAQDDEGMAGSYVCVLLAPPS